MQSKVYYIITKRPAYDQTFEHSLTRAIWNQYYLFSCRSWMEKHRSLEKSWFIMKNSSEHTKDKTALHFKLTELKFGAWKWQWDFIKMNTETFTVFLCLLPCLGPQPLLSQGPQLSLPIKKCHLFKWKLYSIHSSLSSLWCLNRFPDLCVPLELITNYFQLISN